MPDIEELRVEASKTDKAIIVAHSQLLFLDFFFKEEMTVSPERTDLPEEWRGNMVKSEKQRIMICDRNKQVGFRTSRKIAKTVIASAAFFRWSMWHAGRQQTDGLLHCPREHHLINIRLRLEKKINRTPLFRLLVTHVNRSKGFMETSTGITWFMRIEGRTGTGESMVGPAALYEIGDEQDYAAMQPFNERQQAMLPGSMRMLCGVPRGVQGGPFWKLANSKEFSEGWSVFTGKEGYNCFINPIYLSKQARRRLIVDHGGIETQAYQTQVLGLDGARVFSSFHVIPTIVRDFHLLEVTGDDVSNGLFMSLLANISWEPSETYMIAGDIGGSPAPTELSVLYWFEGAWIQNGRVHLTLSDSTQGAACIHQLNISLPHPASLIVIDAHSHGVGVYDQVRNNGSWATQEYKQRVVDAEFASYIEDKRRLIHPPCKQVVRATNAGWYCDACGIPLFRREELEPARVQAKQWAFSSAKDALASGQRWITDQSQKLDFEPLVLNIGDEQLILALEGTTEKETVGGNIQWTAPSRHLVDMILCSVIGINRIANLGRENESPSWLEELGWTGGEGTGQTMPWEVENVSVFSLR
jgi:hypothetical protein